jgi:hypothetical protein
MLPIGPRPTRAELEFARKVASISSSRISSSGVSSGGGGDAAMACCTAADVSRAASVASQVLRLPPPDNMEEGPDPWSVPLGQLIRALVAYPQWLVPSTGGAVNGAGRGEGAEPQGMQTLLTNDGRALLVACADAAALQAAPGAVGGADQGASGGEVPHLEMGGDSLVWHWNRSVVSVAGQPQPPEELGLVLAGIVFNPSSTQSHVSFNEMTRPHFMNIAAAQHAEAAIAQLAAWMHSPGEGGGGAPHEALRSLARFPFTALLSVRQSDGAQRIHSNADGDAVLITAVDLATRASGLVLQQENSGAGHDDGGEWRVVQLPLRALLEASLAAPEESGIELIYGWAPEEAWSVREVNSLRLPTASFVIGLYEAAGIDIMAPAEQ